MTVELVNRTVWIIIIGMALVTYVPRLLPLVALDAEKIPPVLARMLRNIPYAALGALIFPGILGIHDQLWYGLVGAAVAVGVALTGAHLIVVVLSSVAVLSALAVLL